MGMLLLLRLKLTLRLLKPTPKSLPRKLPRLSRLTKLRPKLLRKLRRQRLLLIRLPQLILLLQEVLKVRTGPRTCQSISSRDMPKRVEKKSANKSSSITKTRKRKKSLRKRTPGRKRRNEEKGQVLEKEFLKISLITYIDIYLSKIVRKCVQRALAVL